MSSYVEPHMKKSLKGHVLEQILDTEKFKAFYLKLPGEGRMMSTLILFTPEGIVLMGDLCPNHHGTPSAFGYGLIWFAGHLGEDYLCSKFLHEVWQEEVAVKSIARCVAEEEEEAKANPDNPYYQRGRWKKVQEEWVTDWPDKRQDHLYDAITKQGFDSDSMPGYDYLLADAGWLCAIQQRFAELYKVAAPAAST